MIDRSGEEASDIEELAATLESIHDQSTETDLAKKWGLDLLREVGEAARGRLTTRLRLDAAEAETFLLPRINSSLFGGLARLFARRMTKAGSAVLQLQETPTEICMTLHLANEGETGWDERNWRPLETSCEPPLLGLVRRCWQDQAGRIRVLEHPEQGGELHLEASFPGENRPAIVHSY